MTQDEFDKNPPKIHYSPKQQFLPEPQATKLMRQGHIQYRPYKNHTATVYQHYQMPYPLYSYQQAWVDAFADVEASGMYFEVGAGKTATATVAALLHHHQSGSHTVVLMPPILIRQWNDWLAKIKTADGKSLSVLMYRGTPVERKKMDLNQDFVLMSTDIFKRDFARIYEHFEDKNCTLIVDEAVCVKNPSTQIHKCVWAFQNLETGRVKDKINRPIQLVPTDTKPQPAGKLSPAELKIKLQQMQTANPVAPAVKKQKSSDAIEKLRQMLQEKYK